MEENADGSPALWAHLQECEECASTFTDLMCQVREEGYREGRAGRSETRYAAIITLVGILAAIVLISSFFWQRQAERTDLNRLYAQTSPAVTNIRVASTGTTGSGVVFDENGYVLTSYHVVQQVQNGQDLVVQLPGLREVPAQLIGYDAALDLAVLKVDIPPDRLTVAQFGDSEGVQVGDLALVIGNPFGLSHSLTVGYISAIGRRLTSNEPSAPDVEGVLQTDAAINPGNSGGPLLNADGQVIGINTRIRSPSGGSVGLGFAIPSNAAIRVARRLVIRGILGALSWEPAGDPLTSHWPRDWAFPSVVSY